MLKLEQAQRIATEHVRQANQFLSSMPSENLSEHLDDLLLAWEAKLNAKRAFDSRNIVDYSMPKLDALEQSLNGLQTDVAALLERDLRQAIALTLELREQIVKVKNKPYHAREKDTDEIVARLSIDYNKALEACCKNRIAQATKVLMQNTKDYKPLKKLGLNLDYYMEAIIREPGAVENVTAMLSSE